MPATISVWLPGAAAAVLTVSVEKPMPVTLGGASDVVTPAGRLREGERDGLVEAEEALEVEGERLSGARHAEIRLRLVGAAPTSVVGRGTHSCPLPATSCRSPCLEWKGIAVEVGRSGRKCVEVRATVVSNRVSIARRAASPAERAPPEESVAPRLVCGFKEQSLAGLLEVLGLVWYNTAGGRYMWCQVYPSPSPVASWCRGTEKQSSGYL
jgi:hypothetical protein